MPARIACVFCEIAAGRLAAHVVEERGDTLAFLDRRPLFPGHTLVVPRVHHETLGDLPPELLAPLFGHARRVARAIEARLGADGTFVACNNRVSQSVPHLHVHVVPRHRKDGLRGFFWPRHEYGSDEEIARVRDALQAALAAEPA